MGTFSQREGEGWGRSHSAACLSKISLLFLYLYTHFVYAYISYLKCYGPAGDAFLYRYLHNFLHNELLGWYFFEDIDMFLPVHWKKDNCSMKYSLNVNLAAAK